MLEGVGIGEGFRVPLHADEAFFVIRHRYSLDESVAGLRGDNKALREPVDRLVVRGINVYLSFSERGRKRGSMIFTVCE